MSDVKPCPPVPKKPCVEEDKKKCKEPRPPPPVKPPDHRTLPDCVEPQATPVKDMVLFAPDSNDPVDQERIKCLEDCHVEPIYKLLKECHKRVTRKILYTAETCHEETVYFMEALDKCVKDKAFKRLA